MATHHFIKAQKVAASVTVTLGVLQCGQVVVWMKGRKGREGKEGERGMAGGGDGRKGQGRGVGREAGEGQVRGGVYVG